MTDTDKLKRLAEAATPGPWEVPDFSRSGIHQPDLQCWIPSGEDDAAFIAAANPETILALIAENERLKSAAANMEAAFKDAVSECDKLTVERDEAVALLRRARISAFLARIDGEGA